MAGSKSPITPAWLEAARKRLADAMTRDPPPPSTYTQSSAVAALAAEIRQLQARGFSLQTIADDLSHDGITFTSTALKTYLQRAAANAKATRGTTAVSGVTQPTVRAGHMAAAQPASKKSAVKNRAGATSAATNKVQSTLPGSGVREYRDDEA